ncbi:MAG: DinB family protein [Pseudomonadota bacterium]
MSPDHARLMARYNRWQNESLAAAGDTLDEAARQMARGAFFGSIAGTLNHLLWGDRLWMSRFAGTPKPNTGSIPESVGEAPDWAAWKADRIATDLAIEAWAEALTMEALTRDLTWFSGAAGREMSFPLATLVTHFFNHQTHHRGQAHAMLTAAGAKPGPTDLFLMPAA